MLLRRIKIKRLLILLLSLVITIIAIFGLLIFLDDFQFPGWISFDSSVSMKERLKIRNDLNLVYAEAFRKGLKMEISKYTFPNCIKSQQECTSFGVKYIYNKYGDNVPGHLKLENGKYVYHSSI